MITYTTHFDVRVIETLYITTVLFSNIFTVGNNYFYFIITWTTNLSWLLVIIVKDILSGIIKAIVQRILRNLEDRVKNEGECGKTRVIRINVEDSIIIEIPKGQIDQEDT